MNKTILSALLISSLLLVACGTSPKTQIYILSSIERDTTPIMDAQNVVIKVGPVSIPDTLDKAPIVSRIDSNSLLADDYNRWSGDYRDDIQRIIGENLSILLPKSHIALGQETMLLPEDFQVIINIREFYGQLGGSVTLNVDWTVARKGKNKSITVKKSVLQENTIGVDYKDYVAAQSRLLAKLSQEISNTIKNNQ
ncbi:MAG: membrane integrity-associated transporter subunit PqiC [Proteobacteria bacterium]|nr:membrane integrity-associated transporter subunit PqiC [Pseudomonadota bacterium]